MPATCYRSVLMKPEFSPEFEEVRASLVEWAAAWNLPGLERRVRVTFSARFHSSVGRCSPAKGEIRLASFLLAASASALREALCHEAAHAAAYEIHGRGVKPHGAEWRALMRAAGFEPRVSMPASLLPDVLDHPRRATNLWEHRCPVCHASRLARRPVRRWRCASCREAGLKGVLVINRVPSLAGSAQ